MGNDNTAGSGPLARVLIVDDSTVIRKAIEKKLKNDFDLCTAADGEAGWEALVRDDRISVLVTDIEMPGLDGYGLVSRIRATGDVRLRDIPIIVITGAEDEESRERAFACGATDFIVKPIDTMQLRARVHAQARFSQTVAQLSRTEEALKDQATLDPLTQLCSRRYFEQHCAQDIAYEVTRYDIDDLDRAIADGEAHGFVKVLTAPGSDRILGATIVGYHAAELLAEFVLAMKHGLGLGKLAAPLRAALAGRTAAPSVFEMMVVLGREETLARLEDAADGA